MTIIKKFINILNIIKLFNLKYVNTIFQYSKSQIGQDVFVCTVSKFKKNGYFIEIGSADGLYNSNTYLLEKKYNWKGLLVEPNLNWFNKKISKNKSITVNSAIYKKNGTVGFDFKKNFVESKIDLNKTAKVQTITIKNLFQKYKVPKIIDYISIDTEGSEYDILKQIDFKQYDIKILTIENNQNYRKILNLMHLYKYKKVPSKYSSHFKSWFVKNKNYLSKWKSQ
jgi:FkbM family methyltransferase